MISSSGLLTIDLAAIQANWRYVAAQLKNAECAAVVKADAYGVGVAEVAPALLNAGCKTFFLATLDEAIGVRRLLSQGVVLYVLGGVCDGCEEEFVRHNLVPVLYSLEGLNKWLVFCEQKKHAFPCAIKVDTGMTRLGLSGAELETFFVATASLPWLRPILLMSHLACADDPAEPLNHLQKLRFSQSAEMAKKYFPTIKTSLANSSGVFLGDEYHFDLVRVGAALYGVNPQPLQQNKLTQVIQLKLPVLQVRVTDCPVTVGYGATEAAGAGIRLAVVAGGYADGIHRSLGLRPLGMVDDILVASIGRVSMDSFVIDISSIASCPEYIDVINHALTLDFIIAKNKSLGYEVLTSLGRRYIRQYLPAKLSVE
jgi:alanine racemase